jgi:peptidoglycan/LPS O-acetylase OafA/YrhL
MPTNTKRGRVFVDCTDLDGLRGIAAVWVMIYHVLFFTNMRMNIQGSTLMPLFFLLSGFSLAIGYSGRLLKDADAPANSSVTKSPDDAEENRPVEDPLITKKNNTAALKKYFYNRLLRILPVYYICMGFAIPLTYGGYGPFDPSNTSILIGSYIENIIPVSTWTFFLFGVTFDGPEWTISTLLAFWCAFPWVLKFYEKKSDHYLLYTIIYSFWLQLFLGLGLFFLGMMIGLNFLSFWLATAWPVSRFPIFLMGVCGGILCNRYSANNENNGKPMPWFKNSGMFIPWDFFFCQKDASELFCSKQQQQEQEKSEDEALTSKNEVNFEKTAYYQSFMLLGFTLVLTVIDACGIPTNGNLWFQMINNFAQLEVIVSLARLKGSTTISSFLRHPIVLWLGELSMSLYMAHWPCIFYCCWFVKGSTIDWPTTFDCSTEYKDDDAKEDSCTTTLNNFNADRSPPYWAIPVIPVVAVILAAGLYYLVEEPIRKRFK